VTKPLFPPRANTDVRSPAAPPAPGEGDTRPILASAARKLRAAGIESPAREARLLLAHVLGVPQEAIVAGKARADAASLARFDALVARRAAREPLAYIVGSREFWSLDLAVGPGVLVPRPESETLVEAALKRFPERSAALDMLDLGTGSGCLLLAFLSERPKAKGVGIDASADALAWAARNAAALGLAGRARFVAADWSKAGGLYDGILANPPYIGADDIAELAPDVARYEPRAALSGGADGLECYRALAPIIRARLKPDGLAFVELGIGQAEEAAAIFLAGGLAIDEIITDLSGINRCLVAKPLLRGGKKTIGKGVTKRLGSVIWGMQRVWPRCRGRRAGHRSALKSAALCECELDTRRVAILPSSARVRAKEMHWFD
jgi:release factor glutamine methyltransferase